MICGEASYLWMNQDKWDVINYVRTKAKLLYFKCDDYSLQNDKQSQYGSFLPGTVSFLLTLARNQGILRPLIVLKCQKWLQ